MATGELQPPFFTALTTYLSYTLLFVFGHVRDWIEYYFLGKKRQSAREGYAPLRHNYEDFYTRRLYARITDVFNRPICSAPDTWIDVLERCPPSSENGGRLEATGNTHRLLNLASYNYLGFAAQDPYCTPRVLDCIQQLGWSTCSPRIEAGTTPRHLELERMVAEFVGQEDAITYGMGFATNSATIPAMVGKGCLVLSDSLNHSSIVAGVRNSAARVKVFEHNNPRHLEALLRTAVAEGQPKTHRPWKKILVIIEGVYSMEGEFAALREIVEVKKKYKAYLYLDEAHSIGALGAGGRGLCEAAGVDPRDVDVMMGTFTKSFGSCGGYIAGSRDLINYLRTSSPAHMYATAMSAPAVEQVISALRLIQGQDGTTRGRDKIRQLHDNSNYFRRRLMDMGLDVLGDWDSPVMPIMLFNPGKIPAVSRLAYQRGLAITVVGFPATPLLTSRARICISAAHSREDLDWALQELEVIGRWCMLNYNSMGDHVPVPATGGAKGGKASQQHQQQRGINGHAAATTPIKASAGINGHHHAAAVLVKQAA